MERLTSLVYLYILEYTNYYQTYTTGLFENSVVVFNNRVLFIIKFEQYYINFLYIYINVLFRYKYRIMFYSASCRVYGYLQSFFVVEKKKKRRNKISFSNEIIGFLELEKCAAICTEYELTCVPVILSA